MTPATDLTPDLAATLRRYLDIQAQELRLREEKSALQDKLAAYLAPRRMTSWYPELEGQPLKVRFHEATVVEYDEPLLRERLGPRFAATLAPDLRKIRRCLPEIASALAPVMDLVGSPAPDRVRAAIEQGLVRKEEFSGAFKKSVRRTVAVARARPEGPAAQASTATGAGPDGAPEVL